MRIMFPIPPEDAFRVGAVIEGVVKNTTEFGSFVEFPYAANGRPHSLDGLLYLSRTPRTEDARRLRCYDRVRVVVTKWKPDLFRLTVAFPADPSWLTSDVLALARGIVADGALDRLPILADALQDAGCDDFWVLMNCRHRRPDDECWVLPLLTGCPT